MKYQIGDKVLILHSNEEGEVIDIINDQMIMVDVEGVQFPVYMDQVDFPYFKRFSEKKMFPEKKEKKFVDDIKKEKDHSQQVADGVWITFLPITHTDELGEEITVELKLHLINRTNSLYQFAYHLAFFGKPDFTLKNEIRPFEDFYLHDLAFADLNDSPSFEFEFTLQPPDKKKADHFQTTLKLKPKQVFTRLQELREKNEAHFSYRLFETYPDRKVEELFEPGLLTGKNRHIYDARKARQHMEQPRSTVDLHIEKLSDDWKHLSNYEILSLQLKTFEKYYDLAVAHIQPHLTVIHGVGEGKLRDEIHDILRGKKEVKSFVNQYHPRFGYGATEIFFQY